MANATPKSLLELPTELVLRIASHLPLRPLLVFGATCRLCHELSSSSLHSLAFGMYLTRTAKTISRISSSANMQGRSADPGAAVVGEENKAAVVMSRHYNMNLPAILMFHDTLYSTVLERYAVGLRVLEVSLLRLSPSVVQALRGLQGLRSIYIRAENPYTRNYPLRHSCGFLEERGSAWDSMAGVWPRLEALVLENVSITARQLSAMISHNRSITRLWLKQCPAAMEGLPGLLASWQGREALQCFGVPECGRVDVETFEPLWTLPSLSVCTTVSMSTSCPATDLPIDSQSTRLYLPRARKICTQGR